MVGSRNSVRLDAANSFRFCLFNCFFEDDYNIRNDALKTLGSVVEYWSQSWLEYQSKGKVPSSPQITRPGLVRHSSNGSGISTPPPSGGLLRRDSSFKMNFDDVFGVDGDDGALPTRKNSVVYGAPLTPDQEDGWSAAGEFAVSASEGSSSLEEKARFSNRALRRVESAVQDVQVYAKMVSEEIWGPKEMEVNLENFFTWLLRFSIDCPFSDVRAGCLDIVQKIERLGARLPRIAGVGPSLFVAVGDTIGLSRESWTPATPGSKSPAAATVDHFSEDEGEDALLSSPRESGNVQGIMIPEPKSSLPLGERSRSRSRGRTAVGGSRGRNSRRATVSLVSALFQTPPSPTGGFSGLSSPHKFKRRREMRRSAHRLQEKPKTPSEEVMKLQISAYMRTGRVGNLNKILFYFPTFATICRDVTDFFLADDTAHGPLPQQWRIYLGILAAAEKRCQYYLTLLSEKFMTVRGDKEWLKGLQHAPKKLQRISRLNFYLGNKPWVVSPEQIHELVRGQDEDMPLELRWSMAEVVQAIIILSFYHGKSAMALAWGILPEADLQGGTIKAMDNSTPVAPFGSFAPSGSLSMSTDPTASSVRTGSEWDSKAGARGSEKSWMGAIGRKRKPQIAEEQDEDRLPERWRKTATGGIPDPSDDTGAKPLPMPASSLRKTESAFSGSSSAPKHVRIKDQRRRKSFDECAANDDAPLSGFSFSLSAPNSYVQSSMPRPTVHQMAKEHLLSPTSSTSSIYEGTPDQGPANTILEDYAKFLHPESLDMKLEDRDPHNYPHMFLPMEDFEWEKNASSIISDYLDGVVELLDEHFKEAIEIDAQDEELFSSLVRWRLETLASGQDSGEGYERHYGSDDRSSSMPATPRLGPQSFKEAAWFFALRMCNIQKDDFVYKEIKVLLDKNVRRYLKRICVYPELVSTSDWNGAASSLNSKECCLLGLLSCQAKFLGEVLWGIKAVSDFIG